MKRIVAALLVLFVSAIGVQADSKEEFLRKSYEQLMDGDLGADRQVERSATIYIVDLPYYAATSSGWWTGLAVMAFDAATFNIGVWDSNGVQRSSGSFNLNADSQKIDQLFNFVTSKSVPSTGSVQISSTKSFMATVFIGNPSGGFGFSYIYSTAYEIP